MVKCIDVRSYFLEKMSAFVTIVIQEISRDMTVFLKMITVHVKRIKKYFWEVTIQGLPDM